MEENKGKGFGVPMAIVLAGAIVAGAIVYSNSQNAEPATVGSAEPWTEEVTNTGKHLLGSATAPVIITEFSDTECPFCKNFHTTMSQLMNMYGTEGELAWVYKHFPLDRIHPNARAEAAASECVAQLSNNETFWRFLDHMFTNPPSPDRAGQAAAQLGIDAEKFASCMENEVFVDLVDDHHKEGLARGVRGTPHSIISTSDGQEFVVSGAYPLQALQIIIEMMLEDKSATVIQSFIDLVNTGVTPEQMQAFLEAEFPRGLELIGLGPQTETTEATEPETESDSMMEPHSEGMM